MHKKKFVYRAKYLSQNECPKFDCEEGINNIFEWKKSISVKNSYAHFTSKNSANQDLKHADNLFHKDFFPDEH